MREELKFLEETLSERRRRGHPEKPKGWESWFYGETSEEPNERKRRDNQEPVPTSWQQAPEIRDRLRARMRGLQFMVRSARKAIRTLRDSGRYPHTQT